MGSLMSQVTRLKQFRFAVEIALFVAVVVADSYGLVPLSGTVLLLPLVWVLLRLNGEGWPEIGFKKSESLTRVIVIGVVAGVCMELLAVYLTTPLISGYFGVEPDYSPFKAIRGNLTMLLLFLVLSWTLAAFGEEICFRGFLMKRLAQVFGESHPAWVIALILSSVLFGWGHTEQGISGWIQEGLSGMLLGILFLATKRNLVVPIIAHGVSNTLAFILIYLGRYPGLGQVVGE
jgi:uncharacterized protein